MDKRVLSLATATFALGSGSFIFAGQLEVLAVDLHISAGTAGQLQTAYVLSAAIAGPALAWWIRRYNPVHVLRSALATVIVLNMLCWWALGFRDLIVLRVLLGAAGAVGGPMAAALGASLVAPERRGSALATIMGGMTFAFIVGVPLGTLVGAAFGWRATFAFAAALTAFALAIVTVMVPTKNVSELSERTTDSPVSTAFFMLIAPVILTTFLVFGAAMTSSVYAVVMVRLQTGVTGAGMAAFQVLGGLGSVAGLAVGAKLANAGRTDSGVASALAALILASGLQIILLDFGTKGSLLNIVLAAVAGVISSGSLFAIMPMVQQRLVAIAGVNSGLALTFNASATSFGQAAGAALGGLILTGYGMFFNLAASAGLALLNLIMWWSVSRKSGATEFSAMSGRGGPNIA